MAEKKLTDLISEIKKLGWSSIQLTQKKYRGAVQTYKTPKGTLIPVMFYLHEAFVVEDAQGLFGVQDLVYGLMKEKSIDLEATGCIRGLSLVAYEEEGKVTYMDNQLTRLDINVEAVREDIQRRLISVAQLDVLEDIPM